MLCNMSIFIQPFRNENLLTGFLFWIHQLEGLKVGPIVEKVYPRQHPFSVGSTTTKPYLKKKKSNAFHIAINFQRRGNQRHYCLGFPLNAIVLYNVDGLWFLLTSFDKNRIKMRLACTQLHTNYYAGQAEQ